MLKKNSPPGAIPGDSVFVQYSKQCVFNLKGSDNVHH